MNYFTAHYIAQLLGVSPAAVYDWLARSKQDKWFHEMPPLPIGSAHRNPDDDPIMLWSRPQLEEWKKWHAKYLVNKWKRPKAPTEQGNEDAA